MSSSTITPVILCGGSGTRLWPLSRASYPKQLLPLFNGKSLFQQTLLRIRDLPHLSRPLIICNQAYRFIIAEQVRELGFTDAQIILEPEGKNTAPAVTIAALKLRESHPEHLMLVLPADQIIHDHAQFSTAIDLAVTIAKEDNLVTFGVKPTLPETGYGYIQKGEAWAGDIFQAKKFIEKPDLKTAEKYLQSGDYFWNSGIFLFPIATYISEVKQYAPDILDACRLCVKEMQVDLDFHRIKPGFFQSLPQ